MKKIPSMQENTIRHSTMYLDEIEEVFKLLLENSSGVVLSINGYQIETMEELASISGQKFDDFSLTTLKPFFLLTHNRRSFVFRYYDDLLSLGIFEQVRKIVSRNVMVARKLVSSPVTVYSNLGVGIIVDFVAVFFPRLVREFPLYYLIAVLCLFFSVSLYAYMFISAKRSLVILKRKSEVKNFFVRQGDTLLVALFSLIAGSVITILLQAVFKGVTG